MPASDEKRRPAEPPRPRRSGKDAEKSAYEREFIRAENEDDDGYDPYSDRRPTREPLFERDPWD